MHEKRTWLRHLFSVALIVAVEAGAALANPAAAMAEEVPTPGAHGSLSRAWGTAHFSAYRYGWGAHVNVELADTARDHHAVYLDVEVHVEWGPDPSGTVLNNQGVGTVVNSRLDLRGELFAGVSVGTRMYAVEFNLCKRINNWPDTCVSTLLGLPQQPSQHPELLGVTDALMADTMTQFQLAKSQRLGLYNWDDDGCSHPVLQGELKDNPTMYATFKNACQRHDFGYRNYGRYPGLRILPTDKKRAWIDDIFLADMNGTCARAAGTAPPGFVGTCYSWAGTYFAAVRNGGSFAFYNR